MPLKEFLDSDRVNFLIWRYLLEGDYRETAARFQKEWHIQEPHRHFDFAPHVRNRALVSVVNKGLQYYALERELTQKQTPHDGAEVSLATEAGQQGVFGPLLAQPPHKVEDDDDGTMNLAMADHHNHHHHHHHNNNNNNQELMDLSRKRPVESRPTQLTNGSPPKRPRPSNGRYENGADAATSTTTPMELDHTYPSPQGDQAPITRTEGPEQGTQVDKVEELAPKTTFLRLMTEEASSLSQTATLDTSSTPPPPASTSSLENGNAPILLHCEWNPRDPSLLAAAGTDALARIWTVSRGTETAPSHVNPANRPFHNLIDDETPRTSPVTAIAWTGAGHAIAVATEHGNKARINIWSETGAHIDRFEGLEPPVIKLRWNPSDSALLAIAPDGNGAVVVVYKLSHLNTVSFVLPNHDLNNWPLDAAWTGESDFILCGGDVLLHLHCTDTAITILRSYETGKDDDFRQVLFDRRSRLAATCGDRGTLDLWDDAGNRRSIMAHSGAITAMQWQPLQTEPNEDERLIATGGDDCALLIWNARLPESKAKCYFTMESPIVALAFTPDGAFIAGATAGHILIWKVGDSTVPRASWSRAPHPGWLSPKTASETEEEDEHCLCWDSTGQKLAYGFNSRLAVINFR